METLTLQQFDTQRIILALLVPVVTTTLTIVIISFRYRDGIEKCDDSGKYKNIVYKLNNIKLLIWLHICLTIVILGRVFSFLFLCPDNSWLGVDRAIVFAALIVLGGCWCWHFYCFGGGGFDRKWFIFPSSFKENKKFEIMKTKYDPMKLSDVENRLMLLTLMLLEWSDLKTNRDKAALKLSLDEKRIEFLIAISHNPEFEKLPNIGEILELVYQLAVTKAAKQGFLDKNEFLKYYPKCWSLKEIKDKNFYPEDRHHCYPTQVGG